MGYACKPSSSSQGDNQYQGWMPKIVSAFDAKNPRYWLYVISFVQNVSNVVFQT